MTSAASPPGRPPLPAGETALPLRPLTVGELLDAAVALMRVRPWLLLATAAGMALLEQSVLVPLREDAGVRLEHGMPGLDRTEWGRYWLVLALGAGLEVLIVMLLGPLAGRAAIIDLTGAARPAKPAAPGGRKRPGHLPALAATVLLAALLTGTLSAAGAVAGPIWILFYVPFGLAGVIAAVERRGPWGPLGRTASLAFAGGGRAAGVRLLGVMSWLLLRYAFYLGVLAALDFASVAGEYRLWILTAALTLGNAVAYSMLACLDAAVLVETRIRVEALDLWLRRWATHAPLTEQALVVRR